MRIQKIEIRNFRLLKDVDVDFESKATLVVGRNNSGKTSLTEFFRRLLSEGANCASFSLEDFSLSVHEQFWEAHVLKLTGADDDKVRAVLPIIEAKLVFVYEKDDADLGALTDFIIDLDPECIEAIAHVRYELAPGHVALLFSGYTLDDTKPKEEERARFYRLIKERLVKHYKCVLLAVDPKDFSNNKALEMGKLRAVLQGNFINAHRGLDDVTNRENDVLGKILEILFRNAKAETAPKDDKKTATMLETAVQDVQDGINKNFSGQLNALLPAFKLFGYPGLPDPKLRTQTLLDVERLLKDHTKIRYLGVNGIDLPEAYNGLGARNLIFILLKLLEFFKAFQSAASAPCIHLIFIEEPEAHLHPQMQEVFISKLAEIAAEFEKTYNGGKVWPVQFVVTTHSSHVANKAPFKAMRYFLAVSSDPAVGYATRVKDLGKGFGKDLKDDEDFLHQYMTLTRCDLLFADKAVLIEGTSERILLPRIVAEVDKALADGKKLGTQYICVVEIGGAYAHRFFKLLSFLELRTLVITDLDSVRKNKSGKYEAARVGVCTHTSNGCIKAWFKPKKVNPEVNPPELTLADVVAKTDADKITGRRRIAFQVPQRSGKPTDVPAVDAFLKATGRSFEDAFLLANPDEFNLNEDSADALETAAWTLAQEIDKAEFAIQFAIEKKTWVVPRYLQEGLMWLAGDEVPTAPLLAPAPAMAASVENASPIEIIAGDLN